MKLIKVILTNFRSYKGENVIDLLDGFNTLIGKNDAGKSAILDALDIFFNTGKAELDDFCKLADGKEIKIGCIFDDLPTDVVIDTSAKTTLREEYLLNEDNQLEIVKAFKCSDKTISKPETIVRALHPTLNGVDDLLKLKNAELKERGKNIEEKVADKKQNNLWRKAIWASEKDLKLVKTGLKVEEFETKVKSMYSNLELLFPQYFLLRSDRQATDGDAEAKDPMQIAVKEAQKEFQDDILKLQGQIQSKVDDVAARALEKLHEMDPKLAEKLIPKLKSTPRWTFDYGIEDNKGISLNKRGSGTRRLVLLNFFRAEAEHKSKSREGGIIYAVEEPETSQHPDNQILIIKALLNLALDPKRQVLISTHSPSLAEILPATSIQFVENRDDTSSIYKGTDALQKAADSLGILSHQKFGSAKAIVVVEGKDDDTFLTHASEILTAKGITPKTLKDAGVMILPAGGSPNVKSWIQRERIEQAGLPYLFFVDSDRISPDAEPTENEKLCTELKDNGKVAFCTRKREIENYIDPSVVNPTISYSDFDDAKLTIRRATSVKKVIEEYWVKMTADQIQGSSKYKDGAGKERFEIQELLESILELTEA